MGSARLRDIAPNPLTADALQLAIEVGISTAQTLADVGCGALTLFYELFHLVVGMESRNEECELNSKYF